MRRDSDFFEDRELALIYIAKKLTEALRLESLLTERSVDYAVVLSGEIDMVLDDSVVHLKPGDTIVQQATNHAWVNHGTETCRILFVLMDSKQP